MATVQRVMRASFGMQRVGICAHNAALSREVRLLRSPTVTGSRSTATNTHMLAQQGRFPPQIDLIEDFLSPSESAVMLRELDSIRLKTTDTTTVANSDVIGNTFEAECDVLVRRKMGNALRRKLQSMPTVWSAMMRAVDQGLLHREPDASQYNVYGPDGGIPFHVDARGIGATICMFSFKGPALMELLPRDDPTVEITEQPEWSGPLDAATPNLLRLMLPANSLLVLRKEARYEWAHRIPFGTQFEWHGKTIDKTDRCSFVFWSMHPDPDAPPLRTTAVGTGRIRLVS
eukprot:m.8338 g.8338  ORF g.8338 m.8338 type:complete len:288 (+) comp5349_c0_seq1:227-1090(+)